ncbi:MAG: hypothetical protein ACC662_00445 [Planctomycetota bacterium]
MPRSIPLEYAAEDMQASARPLALLGTPVRTLTAPNRIAYQPMEGNDAEEDGAPSPATILRYEARAVGGAGLDVVEAVAVTPGGRARARQLLLCDTTRAGFERLIARYRAKNRETPLLVQLTHSGRFAREPVSPYRLDDAGARLLEDDDMERLRDAFVCAARLVIECGADGIDFKHCHGYLAGALLGPANRARPGWHHGGETLAERTRFLVGTLRAMREVVPGDRFLVMVRLSAYEGIVGGFGSRGPETAEEDQRATELRALASLLAEEGVRLVGASAGVPELTPHLVRQTNKQPEGFEPLQRYAAVIREASGLPVVGSGYSYLRAGNNRLPGDDAREKNLVTRGGRAVRRRRVDFVGIGRQALADPRFATLLLSGRADEIRWDTACNRCAVALRTGRPARCATYDPVG